jgi:hypothetical protein
MARKPAAKSGNNQKQGKIGGLVFKHPICVTHLMERFGGQVLNYQVLIIGDDA